MELPDLRGPGRHRVGAVDQRGDGAGDHRIPAVRVNEGGGGGGGHGHLAVGQTFWVGAPPILEPIFSGDWDV